MAEYRGNFCVNFAKIPYEINRRLRSGFNRSVKLLIKRLKMAISVNKSENIQHRPVFCYNYTKSEGGSHNIIRDFHTMSHLKRS